MKINPTNFNLYNSDFQAIRKAIPKIREVANELTVELHGSSEIHEQADIFFDGENINEVNFSLMNQNNNQKKTTTQKFKDFFKQIFNRQ